MLLPVLMLRLLLFLLPPTNAPPLKVPLNVPSETLPERPGVPDCPYFLKTQRCKFGPRCKFNHPKDKIAPLDALGSVDVSFYMKSGVCMFGESCKYHHPIDRSAHPLMEAQQQNIKLTLAGLPRREGAINCPYYMKTGACKYGAACKFDHPAPGEEVMPSITEETSTIGVQGGKTA